MGMPSYERIVEFAKLKYQHEPGTKRAVDEGLISMRELTIYNYINSWAINNISDYKLRHQVLPKAILEATKIFQISELEAKTIFEKVRAIPRC